MKRHKECVLIGVPIHQGAGRLGCDMGPGAFRAAGLASILEDLGYRVEDWGNLEPWLVSPRTHSNGRLKNLAEVAGWTAAIEDVSFRASKEALPIFLGGDHALSAGSMTGMSRRAAIEQRPLYVLWLDAHPDFHNLETSISGNLHGVPMAYATGRNGFSPWFPHVAHPINPRNVCMMGIRSVDYAEREAFTDVGMTVYDMRAIDEHGVVSLLDRFLSKVAADNGRLHVSLDVDFLDPDIAPGVGTCVPGGATFREAHHIMEMLCDSGLVGSLDLVELNPFLDERGRTATLMVDLTASLMGRRVLDHNTSTNLILPVSASS